MARVVLYVLMDSIFFQLYVVFDIRHPIPSYTWFGICEPLATIRACTCWLYLANPISYNALDPSNDVLSSPVATTNAMLYVILL